MKNLIFVLGLLVCGLGFAQDAKITGSVLDGEYKNEPLAFAKISIKNSNQVVDTDIQGNYALNKIESGTYTLIYEFVGYETIEIKDVKVGNTNINLRAVILITKKITFENNIASKG